MNYITIKFSGFDGYKLHVRLQKSIGTNFLLACIRSIPILFVSCTIYIVSQIERFHGTEKLYNDLLEKRIKDRSCLITESNEKLISTRNQF